MTLAIEHRNIQINACPFDLFCRDKPCGARHDIADGKILLAAERERFKPGVGVLYRAHESIASARVPRRRT